MEKVKSYGCTNIRIMCLVAAPEGIARVQREHPDVDIYTAALDDCLNDNAYILPGLGDAGDRLNGSDTKTHPRNIIQLLADYGHNISSLYRSQMFEIERTVLG